MKLLANIGGIVKETLQGLFSSGVSAYTGTATMPATDAGKVSTFSHATIAGTLTLPSLASLSIGDLITVSNLDVALCTIQRASTDTIDADGLLAQTSLILAKGDSICLIRGVSTWQQLYLTRNTINASTKGLVPISAGGTANFLRADGTWAAPASGGADGPKYLDVIEFSTSTYSILAANVNKMHIFTGTLTGNAGDASGLVTLPDYTTCALGDTIHLMNAGGAPVGHALAIDSTGVISNQRSWIFNYSQPYTYLRAATGWMQIELNASEDYASYYMGTIPINYSTPINIGVTSDLRISGDTNAPLGVLYRSTVDTDFIDIRRSLLQHSLSNNNIYIASASGGTAVMTVWGMAVTAAGTATLTAIANTNEYTRLAKVDYLVTTAATTAIASVRDAVAKIVHSKTLLTQKQYIARIVAGPATGQATATSRFFMGLRNIATAPTDVNPSTLVNCIGFGWDSADTNMQIMYNGASGTCTKIDSGVAVLTTDRTQMFRLSITNQVSDTNNHVRVVVERKTTTIDFWETVDNVIILGSDAKAIAEGTLLTPLIYASAGGTSSVIGISVSSIYVENSSVTE